MKPLLAEPEITASPAPDGGAPEAPRPEGAAPVAPEPQPRACDTCGAGMAAEQDWCLECGVAAPGRLGSRPGWRAVVSVVGVTLTLAGGAVAASYAALNEDANREAGTPPPAAATPLAQAPPALPPASAPPAPAPGVVAPEGEVVPPPTTLPTVPTPPAGQSPPVTPVIPSTPVTPSAPFTPSTPSTGSGGSEDSDDSDTGSGSTDESTSGSGSTGGEPAGRTPIDLGADAVSIYDPYGRVTVKGDPADAYDNDLDTIFRIGTASPDEPMNVGIVVDLERTTSVRALELRTDTPGFRVETYGATGSELPPDILDTRWQNFGGRSGVDEGKKDGNVAGDEIERVPLGGERKVRYLLVWLAKPPTRGSTVRLTELKLLG